VEDDPVIQKDEFPVVSPIHDVVNGTGILDSHFPSHMNWGK
jgi:hypothetical protein